MNSMVNENSNHNCITSKLINKYFERKINEGSLSKNPKNPFEVNQNHSMCIKAAMEIGCSVVNIRPDDLSRGEEKAYLIMGLKEE